MVGLLVVLVIYLLVVLVLSASLLLALGAGLVFVDVWGHEVTTFTVQGIHHVEGKYLHSEIREVSSDALKHGTRLVVSLMVHIVLELEVDDVELVLHASV